MRKAVIQGPELLAACTKPRTVAEIAAKLGRKTQSVHHHLLRLQDEGLVVQNGTHDGLRLWQAVDPKQKVTL